MSNLPAHAKLKANKDTFFLPDSNRGVYFRNNASSFRMDGDGIYNWIEKLMPMFNGNYSLAEITDGLLSPIKIVYLKLERFYIQMGLSVM